MSTKKSKTRKPKLKRKAYTLLDSYVTSDKSYKAGDKIMLTDEGRAYLKKIRKI